MTKYKVITSTGTGVEIEADAVSLNDGELRFLSEAKVTETTDSRSVSAPELLAAFARGEWAYVSKAKEA